MNLRCILSVFCDEIGDWRCPRKISRMKQIRWEGKPLRMLSKIQQFFDYLLGKRSELKDLDLKDAVMAKVILKIHRTRTHKEVVFVPLHHVVQLHKLERENSMAATQARVDTLIEHKEALLSDPIFTRERLMEFLPSVSGFKVVQQAPDC